jgi:hypothetical protein
MLKRVIFPGLIACVVLLVATVFAESGDQGSTPKPQTEPAPEISFQLVDYHVHLKGGLTLEQAIEHSKKTGVRFGIAENCGVGFKVTDDAGLKSYLATLEGKPVYKGMQAEGREWVTMFSKEAIARFDYVFTDAMTFTDRKGRRTRLWIPAEVHIEDKQDFMDVYVERIVAILSNEPIDIYANPTFLPQVIAGEYDTLWTEQRMDKVINAAFKNGVAIEINARFRIPSAKFIKRAKAAGVKFSCGTNNGDANLGNIEYCRKMIWEYKLTKEDFFSPKPDGQKPVQRKGLPKAPTDQPPAQKS